MAATPYKPVSWGREPVLAPKMNILANNVQWVYENMPRFYYLYSGLKRTSGVKVMAGNLWMTANKKASMRSTVYFGSFFTAGCKPVIVTGVNATPQDRYMTAHRSVDGKLQPDHRGFQVNLTCSEIDPKKSVMNYSLYVTYIAVGW